MAARPPLSRAADAAGLPGRAIRQCGRLRRIVPGAAATWLAAPRGADRDLGARDMLDDTVRPGDGIFHLHIVGTGAGMDDIQGRKRTLALAARLDDAHGIRIVHDLCREGPLARSQSHPCTRIAAAGSDLVESRVRGGPRAGTDDGKTHKPGAPATGRSANRGRRELVGRSRKWPRLVTS